jgi:dTDP-4-dehydrorhamnose reductase
MRRRLPLSEMKLMITGAGGMLARAVTKAARERGHDPLLAERAQLDVTDADAVERLVSSERPNAVIQCAGYARVDDAERDEAAALAVNRDGIANVVRACAALGSAVVYPSTDYVFDGRASRAYPVDAVPAPINAYGRSKLAGEREARKAARHLIVRTSWLYGAGGPNFVATILQRARAGEALRVVDDQRGCPTWTSDLAATMLTLLEMKAPSGVYHACNTGETTWHGLAEAALELSGVEASLTCAKTSDLHRPAQRPAYSVLDCAATEALVGPLRHWRTALAEALTEGIS